MLNNKKTQVVQRLQSLNLVVKVKDHLIRQKAHLMIKVVWNLKNQDKVKSHKKSQITIIIKMIKFLSNLKNQDKAKSQKKNQMILVIKTKTLLKMIKIKISNYLKKIKKHKMKINYLKKKFRNKRLKS